MSVTDPDRAADFRALADLQKRSVIVAGHPTSVTLERAFWDRLSGAAKARGVSINTLISRIDALRTEAGSGNLSSAIRVWILIHTP